jgi:hypothetical protein
MVAGSGTAVKDIDIFMSAYDAYHS